MTNNQVIKKLEEGFYKKITSSEINRGYLFVSKHNGLEKVINTENFQVNFLGTWFYNKKIDSSGRVGIAKHLLAQITQRQLYLKVSLGVLYINDK